MNLLKFFKKLATASIVATLFSAHSIVLAQTAHQPIVIKFSHVTSSDTPKGKAADFFAAKAAELTKGKVKVEVYPNSTLYKDKEECGGSGPLDSHRGGISQGRWLGDGFDVPGF